MLQISNLRFLFSCLNFILHVALSCLHKWVKYRGLPINPSISRLFCRTSQKKNEAILPLLSLSNNPYVLLLVFILPCFIFFSSGGLQLIGNHLCFQTPDCPASTSHVLWFQLCTTTLCSPSNGAKGYVRARKAFYQLDLVNHLLRLQILNVDNIDPYSG